MCKPLDARIWHKLTKLTNTCSKKKKRPVKNKTTKEHRPVAMGDIIYFVTLCVWNWPQKNVGSKANSHCRAAAVKFPTQFKKKKWEDYKYCCTISELSCPSTSVQAKLNNNYYCWWPNLYWPLRNASCIPISLSHTLELVESYCLWVLKV